MPVNDKILYTDYNSMRNAVATILGAGSGTSGYGQTVQSATVSGANGTGPVFGTGSSANTIRTDEYSRLRWDIINVYRHIYGTDPSPANPVIGALIRYVTAAAATTAEYDISEYNIAEYNATSISESADPYTQFSVFITDITNNRFGCATSQSITESKGSASRNAAWGGGVAQVGARIRVSFTSAAQARYFFNSGGEIRITSTRGGGTISSQNTAWTNLLNSASTRTFSAQLPNTAFGLTNASNWFNLTNAYQTWYSISDSSPYGANQYLIQARTLEGVVLNNSSGTSQGVDFVVLYRDYYQDPDVLAPLPKDPTFVPPGDSVDGQLTLNVSLKRAEGVLQPEPATGNFVIESPSVAFFGNSSGVSGTID